MACSSCPQGGKSHGCMLGMIILLLVCEIVISRLCNSLINMVDCFHTLFIFLNLSISYLAAHEPPFPPVTSSFTHATTHSSSTFLRSTPPTSIACPASHSRYSHTVFPGLPFFRLPTSPLSLTYGLARVKPLGALISALLLASLCASILLEILSHSLQPHPIQHPILATVAGVTSLLFNIVVLTARWAGPLNVEFGSFCHLPALEGGLGDKAEFEIYAAEEENGNLSSTSHPSAMERSKNSFVDGSLMFCNPGASSVLDPQSQSHPPPPLLLPSQTQVANYILNPLNQLKLGSQSSTNHMDMSVSHPNPEGTGKILLPLDNLYRESPKDMACVEQRAENINKGLSNELNAHPGQRGHTEQPRCNLSNLITLIQALLGSSLVLANGLVHLLANQNCHNRQEDCGLFVYLDPSFSLLAVLVLLTTALSQTKRYGFLLLQCRPPSVALDRIAHRIASIPGVLSVHELHVWQLTEHCLVASVHVHCHPEFSVSGCSALVGEVTEVLRSVGVSCSTVQPEFLSSSKPIFTITAAAADTLDQSIPPLLPQPNCSLACGKECTGKMCCELRIGRSAFIDLSETGHPQPLIIKNSSTD